MLGTIHYETPTATSTQVSISATSPSTEKEDPLPGKRIARITVAPILPQFFGLWRVCFPPVLVRTGRRLPVQALGERGVWVSLTGYPRGGAPGP